MTLSLHRLTVGKGRKHAISKRLKEDNRLESDTIKLIRKANQRLKTLDRKFKSGTWASKNLKTRLSQKKIKLWSKKGRIKIPKNATRTQLLGVNKAIKQFLSSQTSTIKGINKVREHQIELIQERYKIDNEDFTYEDAEDLYELYGDNDFNYYAEKIGSSAMQELIMDSIDNGDSEDDFLVRLGLYVDLNDQDMASKARRLYNKFI